MNRQLREGEADAFAVEHGVYLLVDVEIYIPVVGGIHPYAGHDVDAAGVERMQGDGWCGVGQDAAVGSQDVFDGLLHLLKVFAVFHAYYPLDASGSLAAIVGHGAAAQCTVGYVDDLIVGSRQDGVENLDFAHGARNALALDEVAYLIRTQEQDDESAGKVLQVARQGHTDGHTGRCQQGGKRGGLYAQLADHGHDEQDGEQDVAEASDEALDAGVDFALRQQLVDELVEERDDEPSYHEYNDGADDAFACIDAPVNESLDNGFHFAEFNLGGGCGRRRK